MYFTELYTLIVILQIVYAKQIGDVCTTPNNKDGLCIPITECEALLKIIATQHVKALEFAKKSQCGYDQRPLVCCGGKTSTSSLSSLPDRTICGLEKEGQRIIGGDTTDIDEFPWVAALEYRDTKSKQSVGHKCGGSIITNRYVLTAAHCILSTGIEISRAWLGDWIISKDPDCQKFIAHTECADRVQKYDVIEQIPHPKFSFSTAQNDVGLLKVATDIEYTDYIRPICLPTTILPGLNYGEELTISGWGKTETGKPSDVKLKALIPLFENQVCKDRLKVNVVPSQLCAGGVDGKDACSGDSGGPLMRKIESSDTPQAQWFLEGIVSWGSGCGKPGYPAIYTRVPSYIKWILDTISK